MGNYFWLERAIKTRKCNECSKDIKSGTFHIKSNSGGMGISNYVNICIPCTEELLRKEKKGG